MGHHLFCGREVIIQPIHQLRSPLLHPPPVRADSPSEPEGSILHHVQAGGFGIDDKLRALYVIREVHASSSYRHQGRLHPAHPAHQGGNESGWR